MLCSFSFKSSVCFVPVLVAEIDRCLKKVGEGVEAFDDIWKKVRDTFRNCIHKIRSKRGTSLKCMSLSRDFWYNAV